MPKVLVFAPCEKVIISQDANSPTLIAILNSISLHADVETLEKAIAGDTPDDAMPMAPFRWSIFTMWQKEPSDGTQEFTQTIDIESPNHTVIITSRSTFSFKPGANSHRINLQFPGFPVRERGSYLLRLSLDGRQIADYPVELKLQTVAEPTVQ